MIEWKTDYSIGVDEIDEQHKKLFEIANRAYILLKNELITDKYDQITAIFAELLDYTEYHFSFEEKYMTSIGYKKFLSHKVIHEDFVEKVKNIDLKQIDEDQDKHLMDILNFIVDWISEHILVQDKNITRSQ
ncbi:bacteriohemerythrin [Syntrophomonas palmitatica]|uniref:bacteriohemerythrin n=1 Tax=Syntrophomonas palmitatica TaxID=402877 RepID=UPI0006D05898|nr:bacteriohemerythrin [Syntrophomonas palmitatica]